MTRGPARIVASHKPDERRKLLDGVAARHDRAVLVEASPWRKLDDAERIVGQIVGVAYHSGGGSSEVLVVQPLDTGKRLRAIPAAHVLRISNATPTPLPAQGDDPARPFAYRVGEVIAGPPRH